MSIGTEHTADVNTKAAILAAGGGTLALAIAMLEDKHLIGKPHKDYPFGDQLPNGQVKTGDAANYGIFKMNWHMIQKCSTAQSIITNRPLQAVWFQVGTRINDDPGLATRILLEAMKKWSINVPTQSMNNFWAGHRWGESGLRGIPPTNWSDIMRYYNAVKEIQAKCDSDPGVWNSNARYYSYVPPV